MIRYDSQISLGNWLTLLLYTFSGRYLPVRKILIHILKTLPVLGLANKYYLFSVTNICNESAFNFWSIHFFNLSLSSLVSLVVAL